MKKKSRYRSEKKEPFRWGKKRKTLKTTLAKFRSRLINRLSFVFFSRKKEIDGNPKRTKTKGERGGSFFFVSSRFFFLPSFSFCDTFSKNQSSLNEFDWVLVSRS